MLPQVQGSVEPAGDGDVPEVAGRALGAAVEPAVGDDAGADAGGDLDEEQVVDLGPAVVCSPSAMRLTSLSTSTGDVAACGDMSAGTSKPSQPGMIGGLVGRPVRVLDRPGQADADAGEVVDAGGRPSASSVEPISTTRSSTAPGPVGDGDRLVVLGRGRCRRGR